MWQKKIFCVFLLLSVMASSQQTPTIRSRANVVIVPALVRNQLGEVVYGLTANDFLIEDDGVQQPLVLDDSAESEPVSVIVVVQTGRRAVREFSRMRGISALVGPVLDQQGTRSALVEFDSGVHLVSDFSPNEASVQNSLHDLQPGDNGAAILDALDLSIHLLAQEPDNRRRVLLLISEMRDHGSHIAKIDHIVAAVGKSNIVMHTFTYSPALSQVLDTERGTNRDEAYWDAPPDLLGVLALARNSMKKNVARTISQMTGGEYEVFATRKHFEQGMIGFTNHIHSRYLLSFAPHDPHPGLHQLRVRLKQSMDGATVIARSSYWAQGSSPEP